VTKTIKLPQLAWHGNRELELPVPDSWQVETCNMASIIKVRRYSSFSIEQKEVK
jgi:hypothetical protein